MKDESRYHQPTAIKYGVCAAVLLKNIQFWVVKNKNRGINIKDGYAWTYNSAASFYRLFPEFGQRTIARALIKLEKHNEIKSGLHTDGRTKCYTHLQYGIVKNVNSFQENLLGQNDQVLGQNDQVLGQNDQVLGQNDQVLGQNDQVHLYNTYINTDINTKEICKEKNKQSAEVKQRENFSLLEEKKIKKNTEQKEIITRVFEHWQGVWNKQRSRLDETRRRHIRKALKLGFREQDLLDAISGSAKTQWNVDNRYNSLRTIFKDADQIERFIDNNINPPERRNANGKTETHYQRAQRRTTEQIRAAKRNGSGTPILPGINDIPF